VGGAMTTTQTSNRLVYHSRVQVDSTHAIEVYQDKEAKNIRVAFLYFPLYSRTGRSWANYRSGGHRICYYQEESARNHILRSATNTPRLRNDGSGRREITEKDISHMRTDAWTQSQLRQRKRGR
jgi:autotransporter adhesin